MREEYIEFLMENPEGKRPLRRSRHGCEDNIKMYITERGM
jgi:hypothetical protein